MVESRPFISATASCAGNGNWMMPTGSMGWLSIDGVLCLDAESARVSDGWCDDPMSGADDGRITGCDAEEANGPLARGCMFSRGSGVSVHPALLRYRSYVYPGDPWKGGGAELSSSRTLARTPFYSDEESSFSADPLFAPASPSKATGRAVLMVIAPSILLPCPRSVWPTSCWQECSKNACWPADGKW